MSQQQQQIEVSTKKLLEILKTESVFHVLKTYKLTAEFCAKYILATDLFAKTVEEEYIYVDDVMKYQPHLDKDALYRAFDIELETRECGH